MCAAAFAAASCDCCGTVVWFRPGGVALIESFLRSFRMTAVKDTAGRPKVSVIMPVRDADDAYLHEAADSVLAQTLKDFELIFADLGTDRKFSGMLREYEPEDPRVQVLPRQEGCTAGAMLNAALRQASGEYLCFVDADTLCGARFLEQVAARADATSADITSCEADLLPGIPRDAGRVTVLQGQWLHGEPEVFSRKDCPQKIMNLLNPDFWSALYRLSFIRESGLQFVEDESEGVESAFRAVSAAAAGRLAFVREKLLFHSLYRETLAAAQEEQLKARLAAVRAAGQMFKSLPVAGECVAALTYFSLSTYLKGLFEDAPDLSLAAVQAYYEKIREFFLSPRFVEFSRASCADDALYNRFLIVRSQDFEEFRKLRSRRLLVSLASTPLHLPGVFAVLQSILKQTLKPDGIVLWLAEADFPQKLAALPEELRSMVSAGRLVVKWYKDDLKSHNKYFHALRAYPEAVIVAIEDNILYEPGVLQALQESCMLYPGAVSAARARLICFSRDGKLLPMKFWPEEGAAVLHESAMQLWADGSAAVLYPPHLFPPELLDAALIKKICPANADLWLKVMQVMAGVPVVHALKSPEPVYVQGPRREGCSWSGGEAEAEAAQALARCSDWINAKYGSRLFEQKLLAALKQPQFKGDAALNRQYLKKRAEIREQLEKARPLKSSLAAQIFISAAGSTENEAEIVACSDPGAVQTPAVPGGSGGLSISSSAGNLELKLKYKGSGTLDIALGGPAVVDSDWGGPLWLPVLIHYLALYVDKEPVFASEHAASYAAPFKYQMECTDGQEVEVRVSWLKNYAVIGSKKSWERRQSL